MTNSVTKMTCFPHEGIKKKCGECYKDKRNFKPKISSILRFEIVNNGRISHRYIVFKII